MKPIIFLDFDGVINTPFIIKDKPTVHSYSNRSVSNLQAIKLLNWIYTLYPYDIVITSTWRLGTPLPELINILHNSGLDPNINILGTTPDLRHHKEYDIYIPLPFDNALYFHTRRGHEIHQWITSHHYTSDFIILDDDSDVWKYRSKLVKTNSTDGLTFTKAQEIIHRLKQIYKKEASKCQK